MLRRYVVPSLLAALLGGPLAACTPDQQAPPAEPEPTPIGEFEGTALELSPAPFCERVAAAAVEAAVGGEAREAHYVSGDRVRLAPGVRDIAHENGCAWTGAGDTARAWVFVPPVTVAQARSLSRRAAREEGCRRLTGHRFGSPATGTVCRAGDATEASYRGLFGDVWLGCSLTDGGEPMPRAELLRRAGDWCVAVAGAAAE